MSKSRMPLVLGLGAAGGIGYYLYGAGGNAKAAENKFESMFSFFLTPLGRRSLSINYTTVFLPLVAHSSVR